MRCLSITYMLFEMYFLKLSLLVVSAIVETAKVNLTLACKEAVVCCLEKNSNHVASDITSTRPLQAYVVCLSVYCLLGVLGCVNVT